MRFLLDDVVTACGGRLVAGPDRSADTAAGGAGSQARDRSGGPQIDGVSIDSRSLQPGQLFVPVVAERDGHDFIAAAVRAGAAAFLTSRPRAELDPAWREAGGGGAGGSGGGRGGRGGDGAESRSEVPADEVAAIQVADTVAALTALGRAARARLPGPVIGVTGSVGKTSVKDLAAAALRTTFVTAASERSFNNELGVPLTLVNAPEGSVAAVIEMGARGAGHIAALCAVAAPTIGVVTRVAPAHLELFGAIEDVARAKGELVEALPADPAGVAVLNADDPLVWAMASRTSARVLGFSAGGDGRIGDVRASDVRASGVRADVVWAGDVRFDERARASCTVHTPWGSAALALPVPGAHMVANALGALAAALAAGAPLEAAVAGLAGAQLSPWRMETSTTPGGVTVLNDAYNASPVAVRAAFDTVERLARSGARRVAVLGQMAELGSGAEAAHRELAEDAERRGIELYSVGTDLYGVASERRWAGIDEAATGVAALGLAPGDVVLVKASRVVGLERLAARLVAVEPIR